MKINRALALLAALSGLASSANAAGESATATLTITGTIGSSLDFFIDQNGGTPGTQLISALGTQTRTGPAPSGWSKSIQENNWSLRSTIGLIAYVFNSDSTNYSVKAKLSSTPSTGITWVLALVDTLADPLTLTTTETSFNARVAYAARKEVITTIFVGNGTSGALDNTITFTATAE